MPTAIALTATIERRGSDPRAVPAMTRDEREQLSALMAGLADGDRDAFTPVFSRLWPLVHSFASRVSGGHFDPDEAAQRVLFSVFARASEYDRGRDALAWVLGITRWECRTLMRAASRRRESPLRADTQHDLHSPEDALLDAELRSLLEDQIAELSLADREALGLEPPNSELAPATLRKRKQRVLARLRGSWRKHD
jgi:DNA-directed RNA polymerase specialized sigma24 family protein